MPVEIEVFNVSVILPQMHFTFSCSCLGTSHLSFENTKIHFICSRRRIPPSCLGSERLGKGIGRAYPNWHLTSHLSFENTKIQKYNETKTQKYRIKTLGKGVGREHSMWRCSPFQFSFPALIVTDHHVSQGEMIFAQYLK